MNFPVRIPIIPTLMTPPFKHQFETFKKRSPQSAYLAEFLGTAFFSTKKELTCIRLFLSSGFRLVHMGFAA